MSAIAADDSAAGIENLEWTLLQIHINRIDFFIVWPFLAWLFYIPCLIGGLRLRGWLCMLGCLLFWLSWPLAIWTRAHLEPGSDFDLIHALKSGFVIPFLIVSLGIPVVFPMRRSGSSKPRQMNSR